jgi:glutathione S-transferase
VRKVLVCLDLKGIAYEIDPIIPFMGSDAFTRISPIRRIPVLIDDRVTLADSTVICEYLEERYPEPALFPRGVADRARARWLEEFADTRMGEIFIWRLFNQRVINRRVWREPTDEAVVSRALERDIPDILDYLEGLLPAEGFLFGAIAVADVALAVFFRNAGFAGFQVDSARWPRTADFVGRLLRHPSFAKLAPLEDLLMRTPPPQQREALLAAGAPLTADTLATDTPRRGVMSI